MVGLFKIDAPLGPSFGRKNDVVLHAFHIAGETLNPLGLGFPLQEQLPYLIANWLDLHLSLGRVGRLGACFGLGAGVSNWCLRLHISSRRARNTWQLIRSRLHGGRRLSSGARSGTWPGWTELQRTRRSDTARG